MAFEENTQAVATRSGVVVATMVDSELWYGTSDPAPNLSELLLTAAVGRSFRQPAAFSVYNGGRTEFSELSMNSSRALLGGASIPGVEESLRVVLEWFEQPQVRIISFEEIIRGSGVWDMSIRDVASELLELRGVATKLCYRRLADGPKVVETNSRFIRTNGSMTFGDLHHNRGGWLAGSAIHYVLRRWTMNGGKCVHLVPFGIKGRVYQIYRGSGTKFVLVPSLSIFPAGADPTWLPMEVRSFAVLLGRWPESTRNDLRDHIHTKVSDRLATNPGTCVRFEIRSSGYAIVD